VILVTGGAGYIGSHTAKLLRREGMEVLILDNLARGHRWAALGLPVAEVDLADIGALRTVLRRWPIDAVIHFAAFAYVGESAHDPGLYYRNNLAGTMNLLDALVEAGVRQILFSSTCATYGIPESIPISEATPQKPINPYGETKLAAERALHWYEKAHGLKWVALRYFNAAGADPEGELGEDHDPETHLIPLAMLAALGAAPPLQIFGSDYPTPDGTAIRDYVHVSDLAAAHVRSREGDPPILIADPSLALRELDWSPRQSGLDSIIETAWAWHNRPPR